MIPCLPETGAPELRFKLILPTQSVPSAGSPTPDAPSIPRNFQQIFLLFVPETE